jgi:hypothetical protein
VAERGNRVFPWRSSFAQQLLTSWIKNKHASLKNRGTAREVTLDYTRDTDPVETQEWLDSLESVIEVDGPERAHFLLNRVMEGAHERGARVPDSANTPVRHPVERAGDRSQGQQGILRARRPHRELPVGRDALRHGVHAFLARPLG